MDAPTPPEESDRPAWSGDQLVFDVEACDEIGAWLLDRLARGDTLTLCTDGTYIVS